MTRSVFTKDAFITPTNSKDSGGRRHDILGNTADAHSSAALRVTGDARGSGLRGGKASAAQHRTRGSTLPSLGTQLHSSSFLPSTGPFFPP